VGHGAIRIRLCNLFELALRFLIPEIVQQSDAADERRPHRLSARNREGHDAQTFSGGGLDPRCRFLTRSLRAQEQQDRAERQQCDFLHGVEL
jgi:hypothetical protein